MVLSLFFLLAGHLQKRQGQRQCHRIRGVRDRAGGSRAIHTGHNLFWMILSMLCLINAGLRLLDGA